MLQSLVDYLSSHALQAYVTLFVCAFAEGVPVVGTFVPGSTIIFAVSAIASSGQLDIRFVWLSAALGAYVGDGLAFALGHHYQGKILHRWPLNRHPEIERTASAFFRRYGWLSIVFGRFVPPIRAFVPVMAGISGFGIASFFSLSAIAIVVWSLTYVLPGAWVSKIFAGGDIQLIALSGAGLLIALGLLWMVSRRLLHP